MKTDRKPGYCRVDQEDQVACRMMECAAGLGLAGHGGCFLRGEWWNPECPRFMSETEFIEANEEDPSPSGPTTFRRQLWAK